MIRQAILPAELESAVLASVENCGEIYLVGGAIRDFLLHSKCSDFDFVMKKNAIPEAKRIADQLHGSFYVLDAERQTGRVLLETPNKPLIIDFATLAGGTLQADLKARDFTINAIALDVTHPDQLIDPLGGAQDIKKGILRPCGIESFKNDPVRVIRAVRFMQALCLKLDEAARATLIEAAPRLREVSAERKRDELFHVFENKNVKGSCNLFQQFGMWEQIFPSLDMLENVGLIPPHVHNLTGHTLQVLNYCEIFLLSLNQESTVTDNQFLRSGCELLAGFKDALNNFLAHPIHVQRGYAGLLYLAILYHDIGKAILVQKGVDQETITMTHPETSADHFKTIRDHWALSNEEFIFVERLIRNHSVQYALAESGKVDPRISLHRFFKRSQSAGVLLAVFHLADVLAAYETTLSEQRWNLALKTSKSILDGWFNHYDSIIEPARLISGEEIMAEFALQPGKMVGEILERIREAQVCDQVQTKDDAIRFARAQLANQSGKEE
jgi:poly(A) polymerase